eukprot:Gb_37508 [translate_table: standard]
MAIYFSVYQMSSWTTHRKSRLLSPYEVAFHNTVRGRVEYCHKIQKQIWLSSRQSPARLYKLHANINVPKTGISVMNNEVHFEGSAEQKIAKLEAENRKLLARLSELESLLPSATALGTALKPAEKDTNGGVQTFSVNDGTSPSLDTSIVLPKIEDIVWPSADDEIPFWKKQFPAWQAISNSRTNIRQDYDLMHIVHVTAEMAPIAKVGGLGDVVTGLARACLQRGHKVEVMLPFYECLQKEQINGLTLSETYSSYHNGDWVSTRAYRGQISGIPVIFVEPANHFFKGQRVYGGSYNELEAYLFFSRACLEWMQVTGSQPDIIHVHEWQTSGLSLLYWDIYHNLSIKKPRLILTIHNMEHYGECRVEQLNLCGLDGSVYKTIDKALDDRTIGHNPERLSLLKGGIVYSNAVTTVSPTYVNETLCSGWLANTLMQHHKKYVGILNGIDTTLWDPTTDIFLPAHFHAQKLEGKQICKQYIQRGLGLALDPMAIEKQSIDERHRSPLVVCITRLVAQKGLHLIRYAISRVPELGGQFVLLGTAPEGRIQGEFEHLSNQHKESNNVRLLLTYSEELSHMLYAAADIVLVPSMYEPCGLAQMIGMRYGAVPIVRRTGGLADTVFDVDHNQSNVHQANGFVFEGIDEGSLNGALERAFKCYNERSQYWMELVSRIMQIDNSWNKSAREYIDLYNTVRVRW